MKKCQEPDCELVTYGRGLCRIHYKNKWRRDQRRSTAISCIVAGCGGKIRRENLCQVHYAEWRDKQMCTAEACTRKLYCAGLCGHHYWRRRKGVPLGKPIRAGAGQGSIDAHGYRRFFIKKKLVFEHRAIMERVLGRPLLKTENVHHINGDKLDNRPENLELWVTAQPPGKRPADLVAYAKEILRLYAHLT